MMTKGPQTLFTASLAGELDPTTKGVMIAKALSKLIGPTDMLAFDPNATEESMEDGGLVARVPAPGLHEIIYAKLDHYGGDTGDVITFYKQGEN